MSIPTILFLALGLAMDAFAVSVASGLEIRRLRVYHAFRLALFFGLFQAMMPLVGWLAGLSLRTFIQAWDHWLAFALLAGVGGKMILEATWMQAEEKAAPQHLHSAYILLMLSIATSIDALAVGLGLSFLSVDVVLPAAIIGLVTFALSFAGVFVGGRFGHFFESRIEVAGGAVLIGIGVKMLITHLAARI